MNQEEQDKAVLVWLAGDQSAEIGEKHDNPATPQPADDQVDEGLRALGCNYYERQRLRQKQSRPRNRDKDRATTVKRFRHYIIEKVPGRTDTEITELVATWVAFTDHNLDLAQRWWGAGIDAGKPDQLVNAIEAGFSLKDLVQVVHGRTIAEHLQAGYSIAWCMGALHWQRPA